MAADQVTSPMISDYLRGAARESAKFINYTNDVPFYQPKLSAAHQTKEEEVDIGGDKCHLCGARRKSSEQSTYFHCYKNNAYDREWYSRSVYRCGTSIVQENRTQYTKNGKIDTERVFEPLVTVGSKCIK